MARDWSKVSQANRDKRIDYFGTFCCQHMGEEDRLSGVPVRHQADYSTRPCLQFLRGYELCFHGAAFVSFVTMKIYCCIKHDELMTSRSTRPKKMNSHTLQFALLSSLNPNDFVAFDLNLSFETIAKTKGKCVKDACSMEK